jgi:hypothetical protein
MEILMGMTSSGISNVDIGGIDDHHCLIFLFITIYIWSIYLSVDLIFQSLSFPSGFP